MKTTAEKIKAMIKQDGHVKLRASIIRDYTRLARIAIDIKDADHAYQQLEKLVGYQEAKTLFMDVY